MCLCAWCVWSKAWSTTRVEIRRQLCSFLLYLHGVGDSNSGPQFTQQALLPVEPAGRSPLCVFSAAWIYVFLGHRCYKVCCESLSKVVLWAEYTGKHFPRSHSYTWEFLAWELCWIYAGVEPGLWSPWPAFITRWKASSPASCLSERHFRLGRTLRLLLFLHGELRNRELWRLIELTAP